MEHKFTLGDFELQLSKMDLGLFIQAENPHTGTVFSKILDQDSAKALSHVHFLDIDIIFDLLKDFFSTNKPEDATLSLNKQGQLVYSCQVMYGKISRELSFTIQLAQESLEPVAKLEKLVTKLSGRVCELEKQVSKDDKEKKDLLEKFEKLEKILERTEGRLRLLEEKNMGYIDNHVQDTIKETKVNRIDWKFNSPDLFGAKFTLSNNNKTALSQTKGIDSLFAEKPIPETGKTSFSFYIEGTGEENGILVVGLAPAEAQGDPNCYRHHGTFSLHSKGFYYIEGKNYVNERSKCSKGNKVSFAVNMESGEVVVSVNSEVVYTHNIPSWHISTYKVFYPFMLTNFSAGIGVTFCD